ncbi:hypothetical protein [Pseudomonas sp.]|uniref:hypothetical protein n=1 Tax=Pseudomonas sp. TaxID=306 RepID=UPI003D6EF67E
MRIIQRSPAASGQFPPSALTSLLKPWRPGITPDKWKIAMFIGRLLSTITLLIGLEAQALPSTALSPEQRHALGKQLAEYAGASQWQQLWQRSRQAGHLHEQSDTPYFNLAPEQLIKTVALTLSVWTSKAVALFMRVIPRTPELGVGVQAREPDGSIEPARRPFRRCLAVSLRSLRLNP